MSISYRPATADDLARGAEIVQAAIASLRSTHKFDLPTTVSPATFPAFLLQSAPKGLWVAEQDDRLVGLGYCWVSQHLWFLSNLFVLPGMQQQGVGRALLSRTLQMAQSQNIENRALITFAYNIKATGLYAAHHLFPREPLYSLVASPAALDRKSFGDTYGASLIEDVPDAIEWLANIDQAVLGFRRDAHHRFLQRMKSLRGVRLECGGSPVGYAYISAGGHIGPLSVLPGSNPSAALTAAIMCVLQNAPGQISMIIPGAADRLLGCALGLGLRIVEPLVLLSEKPFGNWHNYMPNDPGMM